MKDEYQIYRRAGKIAREVIGEGLKKIEEGRKLLDLAEFIEGLIAKKDAKPAFPCNISINETAAHYSPTVDDTTTFKDGDLVKVDVGVHLDGYIADIAKSVLVNNGKNDLIKASEKALDRAMKMMKPGIRTNEIGEAVEKTIKEQGFLPISNLTGHKLTRWNLHGGVTIPNIKTRHGDTINEGDVFAIEPFATNGYGKVVDSRNAIIFKYLTDRPLRLKESRLILEYVKKNFNTLPFAERWVSNLVPKFKLNQALRQLVYSKAIYAYNILKEKDRGTVSQAEHTVIVTDSGCEVITK